ncbi:MAG: T9SS type A sorting domain-containing protein [Balneolaceae bacterium]
MIKATTKHVASFVLMMLLSVGFTVTTVAQNTLYGDNVIVDSDFSDDTLSSAWVIEGNSALGNIGVINGELAFTNLQETANQYDFQVNQPFSAEQLAEIEKGGTFELTFDARTTAASKTFHVFLGQVGGDWARYWNSPGDGDVTATNETQTITLTTDVTETWDAMRLGFEIMTDTSSLFIDNIVLRKVDDNILIDGELVIGDSLSAAWNPVADGTQATYSVDNGAVKISELRNLVNSYDVQFIQELDSVQIDSIYAGPYEMIFDAKTSADEKQIQVFFGNNGTGGDWTNFAPTLVLDNTMKTYKLNINASQNWAQMKVGFEVSADTSSVWFDNVILRRVREITPDAPTFSLATNNGVVTVTVNSQSTASAFDVYFSNAAITEIDAAGVTLVGSVADSSGLSLTHSTAAPHPTLAESFTAHYAVVARTEKGTESAPTTNSITTDMTVAANYAVELSTDAIDAVAEALLSTGEIPEASALAGFFPDSYTPFTINSENRVIISGTGGDNDADISSRHWIGFDPIDNLLVIYAEVDDDSIVFATEATGAGGAWNFDSWEMGIGNYAPESFIEGSTHETYQSGEEPDWQLRGGALVSLEGVERGFILGYGIDAARINGEIENSQTLAERTATGYRTLTLISTPDLTGGPTMDAAFDFPSGSDIGLYPLQISLNDNDATARDTQVNWGSKSVDGNWWQDPTQWNVVAFVGVDAVPVSNEDDGSETQPIKFSLDQNYPNPFNPTTNISFTLANSTNVTLEVFNMLGQKVATLLQGEKMTTGQHTQAFDASSLASGMYLYRLSTSSFVQSRKMMLIK